MASIYLAGHLLDGGPQAVECRKIGRLYASLPTQDNAVFGQSLNLDEETDLKHAVMTDEVDAVAHLIKASAGVRKRERHDWSAGFSGAAKNRAAILSLRRSLLQKFRDSMLFVASERVSPIMEAPFTCAGMPVKT